MFEADLSSVASALDDASRIGGRLGDATRYHLGSGGRAWRARLAIACGLALGVCRDDIVRLACACELVHQASVVHDDVQDGASMRRGLDSVTATFGTATALCVGDHLLVCAFAQLAPLPGSAPLTQLFATCISEMAAAQAEEFSPALWNTMTWQRYETLVAGKSGAMVVLPIAGAAMLAGALATEIDELTRVARMLGMAYQAGDDIEDLTADINGGSLNGVVARGMDLACGQRRTSWLDLLARGRSGSLSEADAVHAAASLRSETALTQDWIRALLSSASASLRGCASVRCSALVPVIDQTAEALSNCMAADRERRRAA
jgi:geranylgeranyl pyrophosphate synthase